jgi:hypothetical protein
MYAIPKVRYPQGSISLILTWLNIIGVHLWYLLAQISHIVLIFQSISLILTWLNINSRPIFLVRIINTPHKKWKPLPTYSQWKSGKTSYSLGNQWNKCNNCAPAAIDIWNIK